MHLRQYKTQEVLQVIEEGVTAHPYIRTPHHFLDYLQRSGDREALYRYTLEQPSISHQFVVALSELGRKILLAARSESSVDTGVQQSAANVYANIVEELRDPQAGVSHVKLLGDFQSVVSNNTGGPQVTFTSSEATSEYEQVMTHGMTDLTTGLLYLAVMETWMGPEYDILAEAAQQAGVTDQRYIGANKSADQNHVIWSVEAALTLARAEDRWNISREKLEEVIQTSCDDRAAWWEQFNDLIQNR